MFQTQNLFKFKEKLKAIVTWLAIFESAWITSMNYNCIVKSKL